MVRYPIVMPISPTCLGLWTSTNCVITGSLRELSLMRRSTHTQEMGCIECEPLLSHAKSQPKS